MPKQISIALLNDFGKQGASTCYIAKVVTTDGVTFGFSSSDATIVFDDGYGEVAYYPDEEMRPQNIMSSANMEVDNTKLEGWFKQGVVQKIIAGAFVAAEITIYRVSYLNLTLGAEVVAYGHVGEIEFNADKKDKRKLEFRSLTQELTKPVNERWSLTCRAQFGDERCGMPYVWETGAVASETDNPYLEFYVTGISRPDDYFLLGVVNFIDGQNAGADLEIEVWRADGYVKLSYPAPYPVTNGTLLRLRRDCGKTETDCIAYGNIVRMRAEHLTPVEDQGVLVPGAYIKSTHAL